MSHANLDHIDALLHPFHIDKLLYVHYMLLHFDNCIDEYIQDRTNHVHTLRFQNKFWQYLII